MNETSKITKIWIALALVWTALIFPGIVASFQVIEALPRKGFPGTLYDTILGWFLQPGPGLLLTSSVLGVLTLLTLLTGIASLRQHYSTGSKALRRHLRAGVEDNQGLSPRGFAQQSQALISVNVPLDTIFIHLRAVPDRPVFDMPHEQQKLLELLRQRTDLDPRELEMRLQDVRRVWSAQQHDLLDAGQTRNSTIEEVLQQRTSANPVAVILGAPGSGKSTTMRWVALHMARACLLPWYRRWLNGLLRLLSTLPYLSLPHSWGYSLPEGLSPAQIPILLRIRDYAPRLSANQEYSFEQFFKEQFRSDLADRLLSEMEKGHCLLLCDGLDEVANDSLRRRVSDAIYAFIGRHSSEDTANAKHYNRFLVTSRSVGYEAGAFSRYAHYTLLDLEDEQIKQFLTNWCPAVERYQTMAGQGMRPLTAQQERKATDDGTEQRERLLQALEKNPSIRRLAVNPLMLTILALIQKSGKTLPHRRIDLYEVVTRTLLDNWNQESGRKFLPSGEIQLAERLLSNLAYEMHSSDPLITEREVKRIACQAMSDYYNRPVSESDAEQFIDTLRSSSGLFVESGQGLFSFMHRTFQEYYVALYVLDKQHYTPDTLKQFVAAHYTLSIWREPLLLTIAYKSGQRDRDEQQQASDLIEAIVNTQDSYDVVLHRNLLFAANSIVDCGPWSVTPALQTRITNALFDLYGDSIGAGRYTQLQEDIEEVMLLWLRGQPQESSQQSALPPLLETWHTALCDPSNPLRQEGATHLLASLAPDLPGCPKLVLSALIPPLLKLAHVEDLPCPPEVHAQLVRIQAQPASLRIEEYAFIVLRLLDKDGPAGWLHRTWLTWNEEQPALLEQLTQHSLEIDCLLTPAAVPAHYDSGHLYRQIQDKFWLRGQHNPHGLQTKFLQASDAACYPHAHLYWILLKAEEAAPDMPWREVWDTALQKEMMYGRSATYQTCFHLRLLLYKDDWQRRKQIATELVAALSRSSRLQVLVLTTIINLYLRDLRDLREVRDLRDLGGLRGLREVRDLLDQRDLLDLLDLRHQRYPGYPRYLLNLLNLLNRELVDILCSTLLYQRDTSSTALSAMYSLLSSYDTLPSQMVQPVQYSLQSLERRAGQYLTIEHRQLIALIRRRIGLSTSSTSTHGSAIHSTPDARAVNLYMLRQQRQLTKSQAEEVLLACTDTRWLMTRWEQVVNANAYAVYQVAWNLLDQPFRLSNEVVLLVIQFLGDGDARICAAAASLLKNNSKRIPENLRKEAAEKVLGLLQDDELSRRPLDLPYGRTWRLDDVLFETLKVLGE